MKKGGCSTFISIVGVLLGVAGILASLFSPEFREWLGIEKPSKSTEILVPIIERVPENTNDEKLLVADETEKLNGEDNSVEIVQEEVDSADDIPVKPPVLHFNLAELDDKFGEIIAQGEIPRYANLVGLNKLEESDTSNFKLTIVVSDGSEIENNNDFKGQISDQLKDKFVLFDNCFNSKFITSKTFKMVKEGNLNRLSSLNISNQLNYLLLVEPNNKFRPNPSRKGYWICESTFNVVFIEISNNTTIFNSSINSSGTGHNDVKAKTRSYKNATEILTNKIDELI